MKIIIGPPGTGKTTRLLNLVEQYMEAGVPPDRIGYFAYTKQASQEAVSRACLRFGVDRNDFPYFKTLHALAYKMLGLNPKQMMKREDYQELAEWLRLPQQFFLRQVMAEGGAGPFEGYGKQDKFLEIITYARIMQQPLRKIYNASRVPLYVPWKTVELVDKGLAKWKRVHHLYDYTDFLEMFVEQGLAPQLDVLFVDEAQDLSPIQWRMVEILSANSNETYIAGDDDQAIFRYNGADVKHFIELPGEVEVLTQSYRIPRLHYRQAAAVIQQIKNRRPKTFRSRDEEGVIQWHRYSEQVDLNDGEWLLMARTRDAVRILEEEVRRKGLFYEWKGSQEMESNALDAVRIWERLRSGGKALAEEVRIAYSQMHQVSVAHGHKTMPQGDPGKLYTLEDLQRDHGLRTVAPWEQALPKLSNGDRQYIRACLKRGETLKGKPRIKLSTIHSAKGGQADNVLLVTDVPNRKVTHYREDDGMEDDERRVLYVALTRAKHTLHLIQPQKKGFKIPQI